MPKTTTGRSTTPPPPKPRRAPAKASPTKGEGTRAKRTTDTPSASTRPSTRATPRAHAFAFRDRVIGLVRATPDRLLDHPDNWRVHPEAQASFLRDVLGDIGIAGVALAIIADDEARAACLKLPTLEARGAWLLTYTGPLMLTDGHLRKKTITQPIPTVVLDLTPEEARRALATHDTAGSMAETDVARLRTIVEGSTFGGDVLARLRALCPPVPNFAPGSEDEQGRLDQKAPITCPHCVESFTR